MRPAKDPRTYCAGRQGLEDALCGPWSKEFANLCSNSITISLYGNRLLMFSFNFVIFGPKTKCYRSKLASVVAISLLSLWLQYHCITIVAISSPLVYRNLNKFLWNFWKIIECSRKYMMQLLRLGIFELAACWDISRSHPEGYSV